MTTMLNQLFKYPMKRRRKSLLTVFGLFALLFIGFHLIYFEDEYSPLQLMSSVENEANRLWHFISQINVQCNSSVSTSNASHWLICQDWTLKLPPDISSAKGIVYSVGPGADTSYEQVVDKNSSYHLHVFSTYLAKKNWDTFSNQTILYQTSIVPNDPADFARNSFQTQTLNLVQESLGHKRVAILKIDNQYEVVDTNELLHFLIEDSWLNKVKQLHFVLKLDKIESDDIYNWYRVVYSLFHKSGFRLFHTAASQPLCLQDTIMESCKYFLSWVRDVPPNVFVLHPPAIDGSYVYEEQRMADFLDGMSSASLSFLPVSLTPSQLWKEEVGGSTNSSTPPATPPLLHLQLADKVFKNTHSCTILFITNAPIRKVTGLESSRCQLVNLIPVASKGFNTISFQSLSLSNRRKRQRPSVVSLEDVHSRLGMTRDNLMVLELGESWTSWAVLQQVNSLSIPKNLSQVILLANIFQPSRRPQTMLLRRKYSALKQLESFGFAGVDQQKMWTKSSLRFDRKSQESLMLNFVKRRYV